MDLVAKAKGGVGRAEVGPRELDDFDHARRAPPALRAT